MVKFSFDSDKKLSVQAVLPASDGKIIEVASKVEAWLKKNYPSICNGGDLKMLYEVLQQIQQQKDSPLPEETDNCIYTVLEYPTYQKELTEHFKQNTTHGDVFLASLVNHQTQIEKVNLSA